MKLTELTSDLQTLCHEGHSLSEVVVDINGMQVHLAEIDEIKVLADGTVTILIGDWINRSYY